jgi:antitoxin (DNA-binding transcriptional repressor) of toxin-antitoxin stability system
MSTTIVNTHEAKSRLSELIRLAESGDTVILARGGKPVARIVAWPEPRPDRVPGAWKGRMDLTTDLVGSDPEVLADFDASASTS